MAKKPSKQKASEPEEDLEPGEIPDGPDEDPIEFKFNEEKMLEKMDKMSRRPDSRIDVQRLLESLSPTGKKYARHLITSGPSNVLVAAKACELTPEEIEKAIAELGGKLKALR